MAKQNDPATSKTVQQQINAISKAYKNLQSAAVKSFATQSKTFDKMAKSLTKNSVNAQRALNSQAKTYQKMLTTQAKASAQAMRSQEKAMKMMGKASGGAGGSGGSGVGFNLPTFLSVAAITAATKALGNYISELGRAKGLANALYGGEVSGIHSNQRDFLNQVGGQSPAARLLNGGQLQGLLNLQEQLRQKLGTDQANAVSEKIVGSFQNVEQLKTFADQAGVSLQNALSNFSNFDPANFSTALNAIQQKMDGVNTTANTLETAWIDIKNAAEDFATSFLDKYGGQVQEAIKAIADDVSAAINKVSEWADKFSVVGDVITGIADAAKSLNKPIFGAEGEAQIGVKKGGLVDKVGNLFGQDWSSPTIKPAVQQSSTLTNAIDAGKKALDGYADAQKKKNDQVKLAVTPTANAAIREDQYRKSLSQTTEIMNARVGVEESRLAAIQSSPFGFSQEYGQILKTVESLDALRAQQEAQLASIQSIQNKTVDQQREELSIQTEINQSIAKRNTLLKSTMRGYLDAVQAQSFGQGMFEKIIVDQENNLRAGLEKHLAKANPLLGSTTTSGTTPFRFTGDAAVDQANYAQHVKGLKGFPDAGRMIVPVSSQALAINQGSNMPSARYLTPTMKETTSTTKPATRGASSAGQALDRVKSAVEDLREFLIPDQPKINRAGSMPNNIIGTG